MIVRRYVQEDNLVIRPVEQKDIPLLTEWMKLEGVESLQRYLDATTPAEGNNKLIAVSNGLPLGVVELHSPCMFSQQVKYLSVDGKLYFDLSMNPECFKNRAGCVLIVKLFLIHINQHITPLPLLWEIHDTDKLLKSVAEEDGFKRVNLKTEGLYTLYQYH